MAPREDNTASFVARFEAAMTGTDSRLREVENSCAALQQALKGLREDKCSAHDQSLKELYDSRNDLDSSVRLLKSSEVGLKAIFEGLDKTVSDLDKKALLLGKGEESFEQRLYTLEQAGAAAAIARLNDRLSGLEQRYADGRSNTRQYKFMIFGALLGIITSSVSGALVWYMTR